VGAARFAPDGQVIVYGAAWDADPYRLYETRLGGGQSRLLDLNPGDLLAMSANGKLAVSLNREPFDSWLPRGVYAEVDLTGGAPRARAENVVAVEFGHDEEPIAIVRRVEGQSELEYPIGTVIHRDSVIGPPRVSPEGDRICFQTSYNSLRSAERGGPAEVIASPVPRINACAWNPNGEEIWFTYSPGGGTHENLEAVNLDGERRVLAALTSFSEIEDVSPQGQILMVSGSLRYSVHGSLAPSGGERDLSVFNATRLIQLSADGTAVLLLDDSGVQAGGSQGGGVFTRPTDGSPPTEVGSGRPLVMTQDGTLVAMLGDGAQRQITDSDSITLVPTGVGNPRTIRLPVTVRFSDRSPIGINAPEFQSWEFSDDGRRLLVPFAWEEGAKPRVWVYDLEEERAWAITAEGVTGPVVMSPDGRYVASNEARGLMVYAVETGSQTQVPGSAEPGKLVRWSSRPDVVYVVEQSGAGASVYERNIMTGARGFLREIRVPDPAGATRFDLSLSRTGEAYAYSLDRWLTNLFVIENAH
jgi:hypothetical protein